MEVYGKTITGLCPCTNYIFYIKQVSCAYPESFARGVRVLGGFFYFVLDDFGTHYKRTIIGPQVKRNLNDPTLNADLKP